MPAEGNGFFVLPVQTAVNTRKVTKLVTLKLIPFSETPQRKVSFVTLAHLT